MKSQVRSWVFVLVSLIIVSLMAWGVARTAVQMDPQMMQMMKQKMMNRPAAMKKADKSVQDEKTKAIKAGKFNCCLKHPCDFCALKMGECPCGMNVKEDKPNCNECKGAWYAGDGAVPGKTPDQIMTLPRPLGGM